jgi:hypothetical protein
MMTRSEVVAVVSDLSMLNQRHDNDEKNERRRTAILSIISVIVSNERSAIDHDLKSLQTHDDMTDQNRSNDHFSLLSTCHRRKNNDPIEIIVHLIGEESFLSLCLRWTRALIVRIRFGNRREEQY